MGTIEHTPGPWRVGSEWNSGTRPSIEILRDVTFVEGRPPTTYIIGAVTYPTTAGNTVGSEERLANAHLISAAPCMYEALESAPIVSKYHGVNGFEQERFLADYDAFMAKRRSALQKATPQEIRK